MSELPYMKARRLKLIEAAEDGDYESGLELLRDLIACAHSNDQKKYFAAVLKKIEAGEKADKALNLSKPKNRPKSETKYERDMDIARFVFDRVKGGMTRKNAVTQASEKWHLGSRSVEDAYDRFAILIGIEDELASSDSEHRN